MKSLSLERVFSPDGKHLGSLFAGNSGSGKTTAIVSMLQAAAKSKAFGPMHRFVIIDPKRQPGDYDLMVDPVYDLESAMKSIEEERITVFWPEMDDYEEQVSVLADYVFALADGEPKSSFTFVLDEASILITPTRIPLSLKRLAVQGRAKRIMPVFASQRPLINRWTDANLSNMFLFRTLPVDADALKKRWGIDFESTQATLLEVPYSFMHFDLETIQIQKMAPVELPTRWKRKKKSRWARFKRFI